MRVCYLHKKRLEKNKEKFNNEPVNDFVDIEKQQAVCHFTIVIRSLISRNELTISQASTLMIQLMDLFSITSAHINSARTLTTSRKQLKTESDKIIQLKQMGISVVEFEEHLESLALYHNEKALQIKQGLVIARLLLRHYPKTEKLLDRHEKTFQKRILAIN